MARTLEFYFDYGSPYSYLADTQVEGIAKRAGATLVRKPMLLGGVFKSTGNTSPMTVELKSKWSATDLPMWAKHYGDYDHLARVKEWSSSGGVTDDFIGGE